MKRFKYILFFTLMAWAALVILSCNKKHESSGPSIGTTDEPQYLIFFPDKINDVNHPMFNAYVYIDEKVGALINKLGTTGTESHKLGFAVILPPWFSDALFPGRLTEVIHAAFEVSKNRNVAVYFSISAHYLWPTRPELWNFYDPSLPGYDTNNKKNAEWIDWEGNPLTTRDGKSYRYTMITGAAERLSPHMCYNSPQILSEVSRFCNIIGTAIKNELDVLRNENREYLFTGITVSDEPTLDNYAAITEVGLQPLIDMMNQDGAPLATMGYCALTNAGYSRADPPADMAKALAAINAEFIAFWAKELGRNGVPKSKMYNHIPAGAGEIGSPLLAFTNAPIEIAFNDYARPGWTTYSDGPLKDNFNVLYNELVNHHVQHWGGTECNPYGLGGKKTEPYEYLSMHFDHGATVMVMNSDAAGALGSYLEEGLWNNEAVTAYKRFLRNQ